MRISLYEMQPGNVQLQREKTLDEGPTALVACCCLSKCCAKVWLRAASCPGVDLFCGGVGYNLGEAVGVEAGSSDEGSVDVFEVAEAGGVVGFDGASVEDAYGGSQLGCERRGDLGADDAVSVGGDLRRGGAAGADGPDGLVGEDDRIGQSVLDAFEGDGCLELEDFGGEVGLALFEMFSDADDGDESMSEGCFELEIDGGVGLVEVLAAFGVADEDVGGSDGGELDG